tara:strand:+ start:663 stop:1022 length:360 start_codon:yes stop_codon:yes gene_type:complete
MYYKKLPNGQWKAYVQLFMRKGTKHRMYLKPGITGYQDGDARMYFNNLLEEQSFRQHFDTKVIWSKIFESKGVAKKAEDWLLNYFGNEVDMGFETPGYTEVREYNHQLWMKIKDRLYQK